MAPNSLIVKFIAKSEPWSITRLYTAAVISISPLQNYS
jgi:hypothetical protein